MINKIITGLSTSSVLFSIVILPLNTQNIREYLDPGTGSIIIQVLIGIFVGGLFLIRLFWSKVKKFFSKLFPKDIDGND